MVASSLLKAIVATVQEYSGRELADDLTLVADVDDSFPRHVASREETEDARI